MSDEDDLEFIDADEEIEAEIIKKAPSHLPVADSSGPIMQVVDDTQFRREIDTFSNFFPTFKVQCNASNEVSFEIPTSVLPPSLSVVYGFSDHFVLFYVNLLLNRKLSWFDKPEYCRVTNPIFDEPGDEPHSSVVVSKFIGRPIIVDLIKRFFDLGFHPRASYKYGNHPLISYQKCPPIYFALELIEAILDIPNCCCICRRPLPVSGFRPTTCGDNICTFGFEQLGVGNSVVHEIRRDPLAADLIFSIFSGADFQFLTIPNDVQTYCQNVFTNLPRMVDIARFNSDKELAQRIGKNSLAVLRWVLLSQRSHIIQLPPALQIKNIPAQYQFMTLIGSPESEKEFRNLKKRHGNIFLWHGSHGERWCSIIRNGLKNASGTRLQLNGKSLGSGIYFAPASSTSFGYCTPLNNRYRNSVLGSSVPLIALCEVAKVGSLKDHGWAFTLTQEQACIVRFLMIGNFAVDTKSSPPSNIPTLQDILDSHAIHGHNA